MRRELTLRPCSCSIATHAAGEVSSTNTSSDWAPAPTPAAAAAAIIEVGVVSGRPWISDGHPLQLSPARKKSLLMASLVKALLGVLLVAAGAAGAPSTAAPAENVLLAGQTLASGHSLTAGNGVLLMAPSGDLQLCRTLVCMYAYGPHLRHLPHSKPCLY